jgi:RNA polymerase primary sigma factor
MPSGVSATWDDDAYVDGKPVDVNFASSSHAADPGYDGLIRASIKEQNSQPPPDEPGKADRAFEALLADWRRQEGALERDHFDRLVLKRKLDAEEIVEVLHRLKAAGVSLDGLEVEEEEPDTNESERMVRGDFVRGYTRASLLRHDEDVKLARIVQIGLLAQRDIDAGHDEADLRRLVAEGEAAKSKMVVANLRLVFKIAHKFGNGALEITDHVQNGTIGLMRAVELFDPDLGLKFSTYATWWIRQAIWRGNDNDGHLIRVPVHQIEKIRKFRRMVRRLSMENGREPNLSELAEALDWPKEKVAFLEKLATFRTTSLDVPIDDEEGASVGSLIPSDAPSPEQLAVVASRDKLLRSLIATLSDRERTVLDRRFGLSTRDGETLQEVGDDFGVTRERIRQIEDKALKKLYRKALRHVNALGGD